MICVSFITFLPVTSKTYFQGKNAISLSKSDDTDKYHKKVDYKGIA